MQREKWEPSSRDILIGRVQRGQMTPEQAEQEAESRGLRPLATEPHAADFDPDEMPCWTLPMALAWIAWRDLKSVREQCDDYRENCLHWVYRSYNTPTKDGTEFERIDRYELVTLGRSTLLSLSLEDAYLASTKEEPPTTQMKISEAEKRLFSALAAGRLKAIAKDAGGNVVDIPQREWPYLNLFEGKAGIVLKHNALDQVPTFTDIKLPRDALTNIWKPVLVACPAVEPQGFLVEPNMIEPMMRPGQEGYVPLCSVLLWIVTEAGQKVRNLEDVGPWAAAVARLIPLMSTGEVQIIGRPKSGGAPRPIEGHIFAGIQVAQPLRNTLEMLIGDDPWISCTPYVDEVHWQKDFNDCLYLARSGPASWTHLQVRKADVLRHIAFEADTSQPTSGNALAFPDKSGGQSFEADDAILIEEMRALIDAKKAKSVSAAAAEVATRAKRLGSVESAIERLRRAYGRKYPTRLRT